MDQAELISVAREATEAGAEVAMSWQNRPEEHQVREKAGPRDLVSLADVETERAIRAVLSRRRPGDGVLGEEDGHTNGQTGVSWVIDPIDGTTSYLYGRHDWAISVAAVRDDNRILGGVVAEPAQRRLTHAARGNGTWAAGRRTRVRDATELSQALVEVNFGTVEQQDLAGAMVEHLLPHVRDLRRGGSAASALAHVATGRADAVWSPGLQPWDGSAGLLLVQEAGGYVGDLDGLCDGVWPQSGDILAAPPALWEPLRALLAEVYSGASRA
ncbi:MAG: inositol monophosphatase [Actinomycetota bacterium]|nr:inositol monophosphatase [Actinomycetota bacterium]